MVTASHTREVGHEELVSPRSPRSVRRGPRPRPRCRPGGFASRRALGVPSDGVFFGMWTADAGMQRVFQIVQKAAQSDVSVLLRGETGTGKELLAKALHDLSPRARGAVSRHQLRRAARQPARE